MQTHQIRSLSKLSKPAPATSPNRQQPALSASSLPANRSEMAASCGNPIHILLYVLRSWQRVTHRMPSASLSLDCSSRLCEKQLVRTDDEKHLSIARGRPGTFHKALAEPLTTRQGWPHLSVPLQPRPHGRLSDRTAGSHHSQPDRAACPQGGQQTSRPALKASSRRQQLAVPTFTASSHGLLPQT